MRFFVFFKELAEQILKDFGIRWKLWVPSKNSIFYFFTFDPGGPAPAILSCKKVQPSVAEHCVWKYRSFFRFLGNRPSCLGNPMNKFQ